MKKSHTRKIIGSLTALCLTLGVCSPNLSIAAFQDLSQSSQNASTDPLHRVNLFSLFKGKKNASSFNDVSTISSEIWSRMRTRLSLNPLHSSPLLERHLKSLSQSQDYINKVVKNASPYLYYILEEVEKRGMPSEIALLPIIESDFNPHTKSHKGALGLWQIMPSLGRLHGLKQNDWYDGRKDVYESTKVALDHLQYLHKRFNGNWLLALAAYNCGETRLERAIKNNKSAKKATDFWSLKLPKETMHFVPKLLAVAAIIKAPDNYGVVLPSIPNKPVITRISTSKAIDIAKAAKLVDISETQLRRLNPGIHKKAAHTKGPLQLVVPIQQAQVFKDNIGISTVKKTANKETSIKAASKTASKDVTITTASSE